MMGVVDRIEGQLLVAGGGLFDPNFRQTVVLVVEHGPEGGLGVVLNRPSTLTVEEAAPALTEITAPDERLYVGGPVQPQAAVILAQFEHPDLASQLVFDSVGVIGDEGEELRSPGLLRKRIFAGYAGWAAGQLDSELESGDWILESAQADDVFTARPEELWSAVLKRKGSQYALLAHMPFDPSTN
jgi:putative transcriptional regulator